MAFGRRTNAHAEPTTDYGAPAVRSNRLHRPLLASNHALHLASSLIVLGISAYFIHDLKTSRTCATGLPSYVASTPS